MKRQREERENKRKKESCQIWKVNSKYIIRTWLVYLWVFILDTDIYGLWSSS